MPDTIYDVSQVIDKTLIAAQDVPIFASPYDGATQIGTVSAGQPVGIVYSWIEADPTQGRQGIWWQFQPVSAYSHYYYAPHAAGLYNIDALREQGAITVTEQIAQQQAKEDAANEPWYTVILKKVLPVAVLIGLGSAVIKGYFSSRKTQ